ncbi:hypothetical protein [Daejeonella lutea]|uniref:DAPG hydrolase PhiG domain-containing protein n=1 Tax=Daejeonella lutea TaxID=572036 RepID=A0A1T5CY36_9SPHI|nr:hypothetical protein [Daejeonella lutea]SKB64263.1 hypothetical protein SAMN05661099_2008 [Daejeonella lutea]
MPILTKLLNNWTLPPERNFGWKMKSLDSAKTNFTIDRNGVFHLTIEHDIIAGVRPKMLLWWFQNIGGDMVYQGQTYPKYLVWHPKDHIHWSSSDQSANTKAGPGSTFRIVEAFDRNMNWLVDSTERVEKLDETGIRLVKKIGRIEVFSLQHYFLAAGNNTIYKSKMTIGTDRTLGKIFNHLIRPFLFTKEMANAWLKHNIEEVGNFEFFLPELYQKEVDRGAI